MLFRAVVNDSHSRFQSQRQFTRKQSYFFSFTVSLVLILQFTSDKYLILKLVSLQIKLIEKINIDVNDYVAPGPTKIYWIIDLWFLIDWFIIKIQMIDNNDSDNQDLIVPDDYVAPGPTKIYWIIDLWFLIDWFIMIQDMTFISFMI